MPPIATYPLPPLLAATLLLLPLACDPSEPAKDAFSAREPCSPEQTNVRFAPETRASYPLYEGALYEASGCARDVVLSCTQRFHPRRGYAQGYSGIGSCYELPPFAFRATDGTIRPKEGEGTAWGDAFQEALLVSAAHDLSCPRSSLSPLPTREHAPPSLVVEGCGERVAYTAVSELSSSTLRLVLTGRVPICPTTLR